LSEEIERIKEDLKKRIRALHEPIQIVKVVDGKEVVIKPEDLR
jgi:hypothetical protein